MTNLIESYLKYYFFIMKQQPPAGQGLLIFEDLRSHSDTPHSVGILWTSDQPDADLYLTKHNNHNRQTSMLPEGFEPTILTKRAAADPRLRRCGH